MIKEYSTVEYDVNAPFNRSGSSSFAIWMSGIEASKNSTGRLFYLYVSFQAEYNKTQVWIWNNGPNAMFFGGVRVTLILANQAATAISSSYELPFYQHFLNSFEFPYPLAKYNSWFDSSSIICSIYFLKFTENYYQYATSLFGNKVNYQSFFLPTSLSYSECLVAAGKMCPQTHPYFDAST